MARSGVGRMVALAAIGWLGSAMAGMAQEKVYPVVPTDKLESILKSLDIEFKKNPGKKEGTFFYRFDRDKYDVVLHYYHGKELWIDVQFNDKASLETVNGWNRRAKFSRALLLKKDEKTSITLESQLDCRGGVTEGMIRQFIRRFEGEVRDFVKHLDIR